MRRIKPTTAFRRDFKREQRGRYRDIQKLLNEILASLASDIPLQDRYRDHALTGSWTGFRECHIRPDLLLIYEKTPGILALARLGSHSTLFG